MELHTISMAVDEKRDGKGGVTVSKYPSQNGWRWLDTCTSIDIVTLRVDSLFDRAPDS